MVTEDVFYVPVTTEAYTRPVLKPMRDALEYVKKTEKFLLHICWCTYCWSTYPANVEIGYECPACGALDFEIKRTVNGEVTEETGRR